VAGLWVKICGVTTPGDAAAVFNAGADAVGLNFVASSPRCLSLVRAQEIIRAVGRQGEWVGVFADAAPDELRRAYEMLGLSWVQLHGHESPSLLERLLAAGVPAYQAVRVGAPEDVARARAFGGDRLLVDAKVSGQLGGTGQRVDPGLIASLGAERPLVLAGGLDPENVGAVVRLVRPFGVDTASGVEIAPGQKDLGKVGAFVRSARDAAPST
jgi:phosphoribosylanthranilate isomerase